MKKYFVALACGLVTLIFGIALFLMTFDANRYRDEIATALCKQTGRMVKLGGPISLGVSTRGITLDIGDSTISNPFWASRHTMAGIGHFKLGLSLLPLFSRQLVVTRVDISNADIQLETDKSGRHNWDMIPSERQDPDAAQKDIAQGRPVSVHISRIGVTDSQLSIHTDDGNTRTFKVNSLSLGVQGGGGVLRFKGEYNAAPFIFNLNTGAQDLIAPTGSWPFEASLVYANYSAAARGKVNMDAQQANVSSYQVSAGHSTLRGKLTIDWKDGTPFLQGNVQGDHIVTSDFKLQNSGPDSHGQAQTQASDKYMFSDAPFDLQGLKEINASLDIKLDQVLLGENILNNVTSKLDLSNGVISLDPIQAMIGAGAVTGALKMNANQTPPHIALAFNAPDIKLQELLQLLSAPAFLQGNANASLNLATSGESIHAMAMNSIGILQVTSTGGNVTNKPAHQIPTGLIDLVMPSGAVGTIASGLMDLFAPTGSNALNCLAVRFVIKNGIARDNGILVDTGTTTVTGQGGFDLGRETIALILHAKTKKVNVGDFMPPLRVDGTFSDPGFAIDPSEAMSNVAGIFTGGTVSSDVPDVPVRNGDNACIYALDHPAPSVPQSALPSTFSGRVGAGINNIGNLLHGFMGE